MNTTAFNEFDLAIVNALKNNPDGLRYSDLLRRSGREYNTLHFGLRKRMDIENPSKDEKGINVKTFDKHLKELVADGVLERIEERRARVFYKLMIPEDSFPKQYIKEARNWLLPAFVGHARRMHETREFNEPLVESLIEDFSTHLIRDSLVEAIKLYSKNPVWARYLIDESTELTRRLLNEFTIEVASIMGYDKENYGKMIQVLHELQNRRSKRYQAQARRIKPMSGRIPRQTVSSADFTVDLSKMEEHKGGEFQCPRCKMHISPEDNTEKAYGIIGTELSNKSGFLRALAVKCHGCGAIIKLEGFD